MTLSGYSRALRAQQATLAALGRERTLGELRKDIDMKDIWRIVSTQRERSYQENLRLLAEYGLDAEWFEKYGGVSGE